MTQKSLIDGGNPSSHIRLYNPFGAAGTGYGSTNVKIRRFATVAASSGTGITYADSATLGGTFTINEAGVYAISYTDQFVGTAFLGISLNVSVINDNIFEIPVAERMACATTPAANLMGNVSVTLKLNVGDIIRAHTAGAYSGDRNYTLFFITQTR